MTTWDCFGQPCRLKCMHVLMLIIGMLWLGDLALVQETDSLLRLYLIRDTVT